MAAGVDYPGKGVSRLIKKRFLLITVTAALAVILTVTGCGSGQRDEFVPGSGTNPGTNPGIGDGGAGDQAGSGDGQLLLEELEQEIDELLDLLDQLESVEDGDLEME